ncbi:hypothetical protein H6762_00915 [Candidatus Nomurabacteria bacterium]|nr:hypothetical protein [Candidatus Nomurabacteria bacterium]
MAEENMVKYKIVISVLATLLVVSVSVLTYLLVSGMNEAEVVDDPTLDTANSQIMPEEKVELDAAPVECVYQGNLYSEGDMIEEAGTDCKCDNGTVLCATVVSDTAEEPAPVEDTASDEATKSIEVKMKYWANDPDYFRIFTLTVPEDAEVEYDDASMSGVKVTLATNAKLHFYIPHTAIPGQFTYLSALDNPNIDDLYIVRTAEGVSPDTFEYSNLVTLEGTCDSGLVKAPCGSASIKPGLGVTCNWMAGGDKICNAAMETLKITK